MRKLLILPALAALIVLSGLLTAPPAQASSFTVFTYLYHPMRGQPAWTSYRLCGWHLNCNGNPNNPENSDADRIGLDWSAHGGFVEPANKTVWLTWKMLGGSSTHVASGTTQNAQFNGCAGLRTRVLRVSDGAYLFDIWNLHSERSGQSSHTFYSNTPASTYQGTVGSLKSPVGDPCSDFWHTMQYPYLQPGMGSQAYGLSKNSNFPNEVNGWPQPIVGYGIWDTVEYIVPFPSE